MTKHIVSAQRQTEPQKTRRCCQKMKLKNWHTVLDIQKQQDGLEGYGADKTVHIGQFHIKISVFNKPYSFQRQHDTLPW